MAGRGFGKTITGANWIAQEAVDDPGSFSGVIAPTLDDVRYVCFEGVTGILTYLPESLIADYNKSSLIIYLTTGSVIRGFGTERPERLRGPQHHRVWADELAAWQNARHTYDMMKLGLRLGQRPRLAVTTTPKPVPLVRELVKECEESAKRKDGRAVLVRGTTYENKKNLAPSFYEDVRKYEGTRIGDQELLGMLIDPEEDGIVKRSGWRIWKHDKPLPRFIAIVLSLDTAYTEKTFDKKTMEADPSACEVWGLFPRGGSKDKEPELHVMLLDAWDDYLGFPELIKKVRDDSKITYGQIDKPMLGGPFVPSKFASPQVLSGKSIDVLLVEDKGSGISLRQSLGMENLFLTPYNPGRADKLARLHAVTPMWAHGRVWAVESEVRPGQFKSWAERAISQICSYHGPGTTDDDDYVDACTQAFKYFMDNYIRSFVRTNKDDGKSEDENRDRGVIILPGEVSNPYMV